MNSEIGCGFSPKMFLRYVCKIGMIDQNFQDRVSVKMIYPSWILRLSSNHLKYGV